MQKRVNWDELGNTLHESNLLLSRSPDRTLQRIARLARLPLHQDIDRADRSIYVMCSTYGPYVGQGFGVTKGGGASEMRISARALCVYVSVMKICRYGLSVFGYSCFHSAPSMPWFSDEF